MTPRWMGWTGALIAMTTAVAAASSLRIAAASNLHVVVPHLQAAFAAEHPDVRLEFSHGSSGNLVAQIRQGAPFDAFLSADLAYPRALLESGHGVPDTLFTYAHGQLVLWPRPAEENWIAVLQSSQVRRIAIAQPDTAPYGIAARARLREAEVWDSLQSRIVYGENVAQALHFAESGNADYAFVAASLLVGRPRLGEGLPVDLAGEALAHGAVVLAGRPHRAEAKRFLDWLKGETARGILSAHGYRLP